MSRFDGPVTVVGNLHYTGSLLPAPPRSALAQDNLAIYPIDLTTCRVWDAIATNIPGTSASDDLGISGGTWGTHAPKLTTGDVKTTTVTRRARVEVVLPAEYVAGETVTIRLSAGMTTTIADGSATVDVEAFVNGRDGTIDGSDLVSTAAQSINSVTFADKDFQVTPSALEPGDRLDVRITVAVVDTATATAVIADIGAIDLLCDIKG